MPIFISYSHKDKVFAHRLAEQLVRHNVRVWIDEWELSIGDSLIQRIQEALSGSSALIVVLSRNSTESEWCKKELSSGLIRELQEKHVIVLPVIIEDCEIPLFLQDKLYADFRENPDEGFNKLLTTLQKFNTTTQGRMVMPEWHMDWAIDWGEIEGVGFTFRITIIETALDQPYTCFTEVIIMPEINWELYFLGGLKNPDEGDFARFELVKLLKDYSKNNSPMNLILSDSLPKYLTFTIFDKNRDCNLLVKISSRWVGQNTGQDVMLDIEGQFSAMFRTLEEVIHKP